MRRTVSFCLLLLAAPVAAATVTDAAADPAAMVAALTAPELAGRGAGTEGERQAAQLLANWLEAAGCVPAFGDSWYQEFALPDGGHSRNVAGLVPGAGDLADRWLVVGAHIDHLGRVDPETGGVPAVGAYYPGAGDNASGVAAVVTAVRRFVGDDVAPRRSLLVCGFGAEEIGLLGSAYLAANLPVAADRIDAMVNLDAVGRLGAGPLNVAGVETSGRFAPILEAATAGVAMRAQDTALLQSDHQNFVAREIPSLFLFTGGYAEMNSPADDLDHLDLPGLAKVASITAKLIDGLAAAPEDFPFTAPPPAAVSEQAATGAGNRQTWFGSVPEFADAATVGYAIAAVSDNGPAARAGLQAGDVLVELGGHTVTDLPTFTSALRRHDPGDVVEVVVERQGQQRRFYVTLGDRAERGR